MVYLSNEVGTRVGGSLVKYRAPLRFWVILMAYTAGGLLKGGCLGADKMVLEKNKVLYFFPICSWIT